MSTLTEAFSKEDLSSLRDNLPSSTLFILYFFTPWTEFSTRMGTALSELASEYPAADPLPVLFVSINAKKLLDIAKDYNVRRAPCVIYIRDGEVLESIQGIDFARIEAGLRTHLGNNVVSAPAADPTLVRMNEALRIRLSELVKTAPIMLFMKGTPESPRCRFSRRIVSILHEQHVEFVSFDILTDEDVRQGLKEFGDWPTYPQLWLNGELVGGLEIVSVPDPQL